MPRLPTILVIGSQFISTTPASSTVVIVHPSPCAVRGGRRGCRRRPMSPGLLVAGKQLVALHAPLRLVVKGLRGKAAEGFDDPPVEGARRRGDPRPWRLVHERHELVREARHRAGDADTADVRAAD